jgi:hypothetical protein
MEWNKIRLRQENHEIVLAIAQKKKNVSLALLE